MLLLEIKLHSCTRITKIGAISSETNKLDIQKLIEIVPKFFHIIGKINNCAEKLTHILSIICLIIFDFTFNFFKNIIWKKLLNKTIPKVPKNESHIDIEYILYGFINNIKTKLNIKLV